MSPQTTTTFYATADNTLIYSTTNSAAANTVYAGGDISVGCNWAAGVYSNDWVCGWTTLKFSLGALTGKTIISATLKLYPYILPANLNTTYKVNAFAAYWSPNTITANNAPNIYTSFIAYANPPTTTVVPVTWNITSIVQQWASGGWVNNGLQISDNNLVFPGYTAYRATSFESTNTTSGSMRPQLQVTYQ